MMLILLIGALCQAPEVLEFSPREGLRLEKKFLVREAIELRDSRLKTDPRLAGVGHSSATDSEARHAERRVVVIDSYSETDSGFPVHITRSFESVVASIHGGQGLDRGGEQTCTSPLEGSRVLFAYDQESKSYESMVLLPDDVGEELVDALWWDMDLSGLLPAEPVRPGSKWHIDGDACIQALFPGGNLRAFECWSDTMNVSSWPRVHVVPIPPLSLNPLDVLAGIEGQGRAKFRGYREVQGENLADLSFALDLESELDLMPRIRRALLAEINQDLGDADSANPFEEATMSLHIKGRGEMLWSVAAGHLVSSNLECTVSIARKFSWSYLWELPKISRVRGDLTEHWVGSLKAEVSLGNDVLNEEE
jgi:hypothetical protein